MEYVMDSFPVKVCHNIRISGNRILPLDELSAGIDDDYVLVREAWSQRRMHQIDDPTVIITDEPQRIR